MILVNNKRKIKQCHFEKSLHSWIERKIGKKEVKKKCTNNEN